MMNRAFQCNYGISAIIPQLFFGADETAKVMTVTATSHADPTKQASATVYVEDETYSITISIDIACPQVSTAAGTV